MRAYSLCLLAALVACVGDDNNTTQDSGNDVTTNDGPSNNDAGSDAVTADADAGSWTPAVLDGDGSLAFWFDTSIAANLVISSGHVEQWTDRSKNHNDAKNANGGPTLTTAAIHGFDALHFDAKGVILTIADAQSVQLANDQVAIFAVARATKDRVYFFSKHTQGVGGGGTYFKTGLEFEISSISQDAGTTLGPFVHFAEDPTNSGTATDYPAAWNGPVFDDGKFHMVGMRRSTPGTMVLFADIQTPQATSTGGYDVSEPGNAVELGAVGYGTFNPPIDGDIVEIVGVHTSIIPDAVIANIQTYLKTKYGL